MSEIGFREALHITRQDDTWGVVELPETTYLPFDECPECGTPLENLDHELEENEMKPAEPQLGAPTDHDLPKAKMMNDLWNHAAELTRSPDPIKVEIPYVVRDCWDLLVERGRSYDGATVTDYMPFGVPSFIQMVWLKVTRLVSLVRKNASNEELEDSLLDLVNYAFFAMAYLRTQREKASDKVQETLPEGGGDV